MKFTLFGVPTSAGTHGIGQDKAPMQLRRAGLVDRLLDAGVDVADDGDLPLALYRSGSPDRLQQNLDLVVTVAQRVADRVEQVARGGRAPVVLGGDCTITLGVVAGLQRLRPDLGLMYFDGDADLHTPETTHSGILDEMGVAILLGDGAPALTHLGSRHPMLTPQRLVLFGFNPIGLARIEEQRIADYGLPAWPVDSVAGQPAQAAAEAWAALASRAESVLLHFDVDAIDSTDLPLANYPHFNLGQTFDSAMTCLAKFCGNPQFAGLVLTEVNPDHDADGSQLTRLIDGVVNALSAASAPAGKLP
ncbi:MAG: arginase family protein [Micromonosporaceae bacterium]